jgi:hypothetical protein
MQKKQLTLLYAISIAAVVACFFIDPIRQDPNYHLFADQATWLSIPNFWNVVSNLPFVIVGSVGLVKTQFINNTLKTNYAWFFSGIILTGFGSGYYHLHPDSATLVWDRLPMTISFMSFLSIIIGEFIDAVAGKKFLYPLLVVGLASILNWTITDDLRFYALVQFLPIALILIILFTSKKEQPYKRYFWLIVVFYAIAKFLESYDALVYDIAAKTISGHTLKHIAAAAAPYLFYKFVEKKFNPHHASHPKNS